MKIYVGAKTASEYLWKVAHDLMADEEVKKSLGNIHQNVRERLDGRIQNESYLRRLSEIVLGKDKFSIGYIAVTNHATYYSDCLNKIVIQLTGTNVSKAISSIAQFSGFEHQYIYQIVTGKRPLTDKVAESISRMTNSLILCCLSLSSAECFGQGINFTQDTQWEFVYDDSVKEAMLEVASSQKEDEDDDDFYIDDECIDNELEQDKPQQAEDVKAMEQQIVSNLGTSEIDLFENLSPSMKKLVLDFARKRAKCGTMSNEQIVLSYCIQMSGDKSIQDLIRTVSK